MTNTPNVTIRKAQPTDADTIMALICALADFESLTPPDDAAQKRLIADAFGDKPRFEVFLADAADGNTAGYVFIFETYSTFLALPTLYLEDLFVLPTYRQQQIGHALFEFCAAEALRRGCGRFEWTVLDWNVNAIAFYERHNAKRLGEWLHYRLTAPEIAQLLNS
jgi:GNAT superfamily N-acetyltransferase